MRSTYLRIESKGRELRWTLKVARKLGRAVGEGFGVGQVRVVPFSNN